jgi:hypothetical protein
MVTFFYILLQEKDKTDSLWEVTYKKEKME